VTVSLDQQDAIALAERADGMTRDAQHSGLSGRAVADDKRAAAVGEALDQLPQRRAEQPGLVFDEVGSTARIASRSAPLPAARAASRHRSSTGERNPVATAIGMPSWPAACRRISSIRVARAAPVETNAAYGGCSPQRPIAAAAAIPSGVSASPSLSVCRRSSTYRVPCPSLIGRCHTGRRLAPRSDGPERMGPGHYPSTVTQSDQHGPVLADVVDETPRSSRRVFPANAPSRPAPATPPSWAGPRCSSATSSVGPSKFDARSPVLIVAEDSPDVVLWKAGAAD